VVVTQPMLLLRWFSAGIAALAFATPCAAGMEKEGQSTLPGLFFARLPPGDDVVLAHFEKAAHLRALVRHCDAGRDVFALRSGVTGKCKADVIKSPSGDMVEVQITVQGTFPPSDTAAYDVFSTSPPKTPRWTTRKISGDEQRALKATLAADPKRFGAMKPHLKLSRATLAHKPGASEAVIVVPGEVIDDPEAFYYEQKHQVFVKRGGAYVHAGEVPGTPAGFVDAAGAGLPAFLVETGCDGWCISLWGVSGGLRQLGSFGGH